ncbi:MAG TPA: cupin domain-containing protein [Solirubrobacterales bacterium]|nr:cupin domain-containing protein [Solirubrobacterales bacterium]
MSDQVTEVITGEGYAAGSLDGMGDGPGFRKIRTELDIKELGMNAIVMPPGMASGTHWHDDQEEVYFVHQGTLRMTLGENDENQVTLGPGGVIRVDASTQRSVANPGDVDAVYVIVGAKGGYVGRDGHHREGQPRVTTIES